jgi:L-iditol 2-dehydrogenase
MLAFVYRAPNDLRLETRDVPEPGRGDVVLAVRACGICGTDLKIARGEHRAYPPGTVRVPGHEIVAEVAAIGAGVEELREGDNVFVAPNLGCGECLACRAGRVNLCRRPQAFGITLDGGFSEYLRVPAAAVSQGVLLPVPAQADPAVISVVEPLASVIRGARATSTGRGDTVLIFGAGPIGVLHLLVAKARAAEQVIVSEPSPSRRERAASLGAAAAVAPDEVERVVSDFTDGRGADVVVTAVALAGVQELALSLAAAGGRVNYFGGLPAGASRIHIDSNLIHYHELVVTGTTANTTEDCREALELVLSGALDPRPLISARYPLERAADAFAHAASGDALKVVVQPSSKPPKEQV